MLKYQIATEIFMMIVFLLFVFEVGLVGNIMRNKIFDSINIFVMYCIQPLFILNGDVNFRDRVLRHGFLNALKMELLFWWTFNSCNKWDEVRIKVHTYLIIPTNIYMIQFTFICIPVDFFSSTWGYLLAQALKRLEWAKWCLMDKTAVWKHYKNYIFMICHLI